MSQHKHKNSTTDQEKQLDETQSEETQPLSTDDSQAAGTETDVLKARLDDAEKRYLYLQAEFQTFRRRMEEQARTERKYATEDLIKALLPALDNFERALHAAEQTSNFEALMSGIQSTHKQLSTALEKVGLTPINAVGEEFNPHYHEAVGHAQDTGLDPNTVAEEVQKGYMFHDKVLRPTLVRVSD